MKYASFSTSPATPEEQSFTSIIEQDTVLLSFLQTGTIKASDRFIEAAIYKTPAFLAFISPYFEEVFTPAVIRCFQDKDVTLLGGIRANPILLDSMHKEKSYRAILQHLKGKQSNLLTLRNQLQLKEKVNPAVLEEETGIITIGLLNELPDEFQAFRTEYAKELVKTARVLSMTNHAGASAMLSNILELNCDSSAAYQAEQLYRELESVDGEARQREVKKANKLLPLFVGVIILIFIIRVIFAISAHDKP